MPDLAYGTVQSNYGRSGYETQARQLYNRSCIQGWLRRVWSSLNQSSNRLLCLVQIEAAGTRRGNYAAGQQNIPIGSIRGSAVEGRCRDFDQRFRPLNYHNEARWLSIAQARLNGIDLPPVSLVQVEDLYFVLDGHHRISVASALGQEEIEAEVQVWRTGSF